MPDDAGMTSQKEAKTLTIWKKDSNNVNNGYPILNWQN